jgi:hypothetical protein
VKVIFTNEVEYEHCIYYPDAKQAYIRGFRSESDAPDKNVVVVRDVSEDRPEGTAAAQSEAPLALIPNPVFLQDCREWNRENLQLCRNLARDNMSLGPPLHGFSFPNGRCSMA